MKTESILVVKRENLFSSFFPVWQGLKSMNIHAFLSIINEHKEFHVRFAMETDESYKQIIPYLVFTYNDTYFLMQRKKTASEQRLQNLSSLGIGGHIRQEDMPLGSTLIDWAKREFEEEVAYTGSYTVELLGVLNDDSNQVGRVHLGVVLLLRADSPAISIVSEHQSGKLVSLEECRELYDSLEPWTKYIVDSFK